MGRITIHSEPAIRWQIAAAEKFKSGLKALGITASISSSRVRESDIAVLLGTTCFSYWWTGLHGATRITFRLSGTDTGGAAIIRFLFGGEVAGSAWNSHLFRGAWEGG
jgi:hypothetical protein